MESIAIHPPGYLSGTHGCCCSLCCRCCCSPHLCCLPLGLAQCLCKPQQQQRAACEAVATGEPIYHIAHIYASLYRPSLLCTLWCSHPNAGLSKSSSSSTSCSQRNSGLSSPLFIIQCLTSSALLPSFPHLCLPPHFPYLTTLLMQYPPHPCLPLPLCCLPSSACLYATPLPPPLPPALPCPCTPPTEGRGRPSPLIYF